MERKLHYFFISYFGILRHLFYIERGKRGRETLNDNEESLLKENNSISNNFWTMRKNEIVINQEGRIDGVDDIRIERYERMF